MHYWTFYLSVLNTVAHSQYQLYYNTDSSYVLHVLLLLATVWHQSLLQLSLIFWFCSIGLFSGIPSALGWVGNVSKGPLQIVVGGSIQAACPYSLSHHVPAVLTPVDPTTEKFAKYWQEMKQISHRQLHGNICKQSQWGGDRDRVVVAHKHKTGHLVPYTSKFSDQDMPPGMYHPRSVAWELIRYGTFSWRESNPLLWSRDHGLEIRVHSSSFCPGLGLGLKTWWPRSRSWSRNLITQVSVLVLRPKSKVSVLVSRQHAWCLSL